MIELEYLGLNSISNIKVGFINSLKTLLEDQIKIEELEFDTIIPNLTDF